MTIDQFKVLSMSCQHCVHAITKEVSALPGVKRVDVNLGKKSVQVEHDEQVTAGQVVKAINEAGYDQVSVLV